MKMFFRFNLDKNSPLLVGEGERSLLDRINFFLAACYKLSPATLFLNVKTGEMVYRCSGTGVTVKFTIF
jgi:hypothetical protein